MSSDFTFIDLFAGIGGFKSALEQEGGASLGFSEINKDAIDYYCINYGELPESNLGDITQIKTLPKHNLLTAGVPCQSWSIAGKNLGFNDDRGQLWNDTIYLLEKSKPDAFIFENVKGLADPRNKKALTYIMERIYAAGYFANYYLVNSADYGVLQNRVRVFIIGFKERKFFNQFSMPKKFKDSQCLGDLFKIDYKRNINQDNHQQLMIFKTQAKNRNMSLSSSTGINDYFLFNDIRNGETTIHSWDILNTTEKEKNICNLLLTNRRKSKYGKLDGNPLSLRHLQELDPQITQEDLNNLIDLKIIKRDPYCFKINQCVDTSSLTSSEKIMLESNRSEFIYTDDLKTSNTIKINKINIANTLESLVNKYILSIEESRYTFKNGRISSGINGINRIFLPTSTIFPTLVASDSNDYIATKDIDYNNKIDFKTQFLNEIYYPGNYRLITKKEACLIQGFPADFQLPNSRARWAKLLGNSVSIPVIQELCKAIQSTGVFNKKINNQENSLIAA